MGEAMGVSGGVSSGRGGVSQGGVSGGNGGRNSCSVSAEDSARESTHLDNFQVLSPLKRRPCRHFLVNT